MTMCYIHMARAAGGMLSRLCRGGYGPGSSPARPYRHSCEELLFSEQLLKDMGLRREDLLRKGGPPSR